MSNWFLVDISALISINQDDKQQKAANVQNICSPSSCRIWGMANPWISIADPKETISCCIRMNDRNNSFNYIMVNIYSILLNFSVNVKYI